MTTSHYILVADDEVMVRRFLVRVVQTVAPHMHVIEASDGTEALAAAARIRPELGLGCLRATGRHSTTRFQLSRV